MQLSHDDFGRRDAFALVNVGRDAAAVVAHRYRAVGIERDQDLLGIAGERLVDRIVDDLIDHMMQAGAVIGVTDVHARTLAHGVEALEDLDGVGVIVGRVERGLLTGWFGHEEPLQEGAGTRESRTLFRTKTGGAYRAK